MAEKKDSLLKMVLSLGIITIVASLTLALGYEQTKDIIALEEENNKTKAIELVAPKYDNNPLSEKYIYVARENTKDSITTIVYPATLNGKLVGAAVESASNNAFSGEIRIIVGLDIKGSIINYKVIKHTETAGLGSKMQKWFSTNKNNQSVINQNPSVQPLVVKKDAGGTIDGITAATITSRAFLSALNDAGQAFSAYKKSLSEGGSMNTNE